MGRRSQSRLPRRARLAALVAYLVLAVLLFSTTWASPTARWIGDGGDPPLFMWFLRWVPYALSHGANPFVTSHLNFPDGVNLMWNTPVPLAGLLAAPLTVAMGPILAYNLLVTLAVAASAWCAYLMLRRYVASPWAAGLGGLLYGFSPYVLAHARAHLNLTAALVPPLMFLLLDDVLVRQRRPPIVDGLLLGLLAAAQLLLSEELLASEMLVAVVGLAVLVALDGRRAMEPARVAHAFRALAVALAVSLAIAAWPLYVQFFGPQRVRGGTLWRPDVFVSDLLAFVVPSGNQALGSAWTRAVAERFSSACCVAEKNAYLGLPLLAVLGGAVVWLRSKPLVRFAGVLAGALVVLSMGPHLQVGGRVTPLVLPFRMVSVLPVFGNILAGRLTLYVFLLASVIVAVLVEEAAKSRGWHPALVALPVAAALVPLAPALPFPSKPAEVPTFFTSAAVERIPEGGVVLVAPFPHDTNTAEPMLWQAVSGMRYRMLGGYALGPDRSGKFGFLPLPTDLSETMARLLAGESPELTEDLRARMWSALEASRVDAVVVGPMPNRSATVAFFGSLLGREGVGVGGVDLWTGLRGEARR